MTARPDPGAQQPWMSQLRPPQTPTAIQQSAQEDGYDYGCGATFTSPSGAFLFALSLLFSLPSLSPRDINSASTSYLYLFSTTLLCHRSLLMISLLVWV